MYLVGNNIFNFLNCISDDMHKVRFFIYDAVQLEKGKNEPIEDYYYDETEMYYSYDIPYPYVTKPCRFLTTEEVERVTHCNGSAPVELTTYQNNIGTSYPLIGIYCTFDE